MLSYKNRFHGHGSLRYVYKNGQAERTHLVTMKHTANPRRKHSRVAVVISKKVLKSAVRRNLVRRRVYEVIRLELPELDRPTDIAMIIVSSEIINMPPEELQQLIKQLFTAANLYKKQS